MKCPSCNKRIKHRQATFCPHCGARVKTDAESPSIHATHDLQNYNSLYSGLDDDEGEIAYSIPQPKSSTIHTIDKWVLRILFMGLALFIVYVNIGPKITPEGQKTSDFISGEYWYNGFKEFTSNFGKPNAEKQTYNHISDKNNPGETAQQEENTETKPYNPFDYYQYITYKENEIVFGEERTIQAVIGVPNLGKSDNVRRVLEYIQSQEQQSNDTWIVLMTNKDPADRNFTEIDSWDGYIGTLLFINNIENIEEKIPHNYTKIDIQTYVQWQ